MYIMCVILCLFSALTRRVGALQISIIITIVVVVVVNTREHWAEFRHEEPREFNRLSLLLFFFFFFFKEHTNLKLMTSPEIGLRPKFRRCVLCTLLSANDDWKDSRWEEQRNLLAVFKRIDMQASVSESKCKLIITTNNKICMFLRRKPRQEWRHWI